MCARACLFFYRLNYNNKSTPFCEFATFYLHTSYTNVYKNIIIHPRESGIINILVNLNYLHNSCQTPKRKCQASFRVLHSHFISHFKYHVRFHNMSHDMLHTRNEIIFVVVAVINYNIHTYNRSQWSVRKQTNKQTIYKYVYKYVNTRCPQEYER